jgi:hypothetical protein
MVLRRIMRLHRDYHGSSIVAEVITVTSFHSVSGMATLVDLYDMPRLYAVKNRNITIHDTRLEGVIVHFVTSIHSLYLASFADCIEE